MPIQSFFSSFFLIQLMAEKFLWLFIYNADLQWLFQVERCTSRHA